jgi:hypothetical protein
MNITGFKGIHNTQPPRSIPDDALTDATDIDIDDSGAAIKRGGYSQAKSVTIDDAYTTLDGRTYLVSDSNLYRVDDSLEVIDLGGTTATAFCDYGDTLFTNDGLMVRGDSVTDLTIKPGTSPDLTVVPGNLPAGTYQATYTVKNSAGLESVAAPIASVTIDDDESVIVTPPVANTVSYLTDADGTVYYTESGYPLDPVLLGADSFPERVEFMEFWDSALWCSRSMENETVIFFSKPFHYHVFDYEANHIIVPGKVLAMAATQEGLVIGTQTGLFLYNDSLIQLARYGVIPGRPIVKLPNGSVLIHTERGVCTVPFQNLTENKVSLPMGSKCSTAVVYQNGMQKYVALHDGGAAFNQSS